MPTDDPTNGNGLDKLSEPEWRLLELLDSAGCILTSWTGQERWALDAEELCDLIEVAVELATELAADGDAAAVRKRAACLLGVTETGAFESG